ncbi:MAG TPA: hypothetical protein DCS19_09550 [Flavobacterium sp.]|nr:hypothetical protein [Flavobacterium sp.]
MTEQETYEIQLRIFQLKKDIMACQQSKNDFEKAIFEAEAKVRKSKQHIMELNVRIQEYVGKLEQINAEIGE